MSIKYEQILLKYIYYILYVYYIKLKCIYLYKHNNIISDERNSFNYSYC